MTETHKQSNKNNSNNINLHHCHWLPCSIDYDGLAPIHLHFRPETITTLNGNDNNGDNNNKDDNNKTIIQAASFRGRGLLSKTHSTSNNNDQQPAKTLPLGIIGSVLSIDEHQQHHHHHHRQQEQEQQSNNNHLPMLITKEKFDTILEWEHESNENNLIQVEDLNIVGEEGKEMSNDDMKLMYDTQTQGSIGKSLAIFDILHAVHTPIPVEEEG